MKVNFNKAKKKIAVIWFVFSVIVFLLVFVQSLTGKYEDKNQYAWGWFFSSVTPMLFLMISVFKSDREATAAEEATIDSFYYRLTAGLSILYLGLLAALILLQPLTHTPIIELMKDSYLFLGPVHGVVSASMGLFFVHKEKGSTSNSL